MVLSVRCARFVPFGVVIRAIECLYVSVRIWFVANNIDGVDLVP